MKSNSKEQASRRTPGKGCATPDLYLAHPTSEHRTADGRAVLRSSVREYVCSEAMAALGIPTTRALSLVATGEAVVRDQFYSGQVKVRVSSIQCPV